MGNISEIVKALERMLTLLGPEWTLALVVVIVGLPILAFWHRMHVIKKAYTTALDTKEDAIQRLAKDNRVWVKYFLLKGGLTKKELMDIGALVPEDEQGKPLKLKQKSKKPAKKR